MSENIRVRLKNYLDVPEFRQLLEQLKNKYVNYGACIGKISVEAKSAAEAFKLSGFLSLHVKVGVKTNIKISTIQKSLDDSVFDGMTVHDMVFLFWPDLRSKKEIRLEENQYVEQMMGEYLEKYRGSFIGKLFAHDQARKKMSYLIRQDAVLLDFILRGLSRLPIFDDDVCSLSIFASQVTGDPHYYDLDTSHCHTLIQFLCFLFDYSFPLERNGKKEILELCGIMVDEVSNSVITYYLSGNEMLDSFHRSLTPLTINLANINLMDTVRAENGVVLIIENPSFMSKVISKPLPYSVIITSGNSNLVVYKLLEKMGNVQIYFNGDFDPEGLLIAQGFKTRYPSMRLLGYCEDYYQRGISQNVIREPRLKKLDHVVDPGFLEIKNLLLEEKLASYQETNYDLIMEEMEHILEDFR